MPLYLIGLGLARPSDITLHGLQTLQKCQRIYLEAYTSILLSTSSASSEFDPEESARTLQAELNLTTPIEIADRDLVESGSDTILADTEKPDVNVAFLVVGDPFGATTHTDLVLRAKARNVKVGVVHNASIMNAVGCTGLQLYNFGQTVSMVFFDEENGWKPSSWYDKILENDQLGLHTLVLLDIKVREQNWENLARGRKIYEKPRFMLGNTCARQMLEIEEDRKTGVCGSDKLAVVVAKVGSDEERISVGTLEELAALTDEQLGGPLQSLILVGKKVHVLELQFLREFVQDKERYDSTVEKLYGKQEWETM
ncbi:Diphthine synthase [Ascobolus immersus RN42]|uniref:diphthine methyl ester synthase n=1 Tax=Ascobolus immersus RN42 TaxID=1160509 RepID=A0A3N4I2T0_ASCIM|nr:Diphthine synthase [Ascobolus immersus RN42]